jgi:inorganic pyrophosphatase
MNLYKIPQHQLFPKIVKAVVEIPRGTSAKYEYNPEGYFEFDRGLLTAMTYPSNYGFIPNTLAGDGDALDILIYNGTPIERGTVVECRVLGVLDMDDDGKKDYKILGVPTSHVRPYFGIQDIDPLFLEICKNFFQHYKDLNDKNVVLHDWHDKDFAKEIVQESFKTS